MPFISLGDKQLVTPGKKEACVFTFIKPTLCTSGTSFPQKNRVPETVEGQPCPDNVSTTEGLGLRQRRPAREGMWGAPARFNSGSPRTPTGGPGTERLLDAQPALAARTLCPIQLLQPQDGPTRILLTCPPSAALR